MEPRNKALSQLRKSLRSGRGDEMPMQKVSVIAPDKKGLEEGLEKAEDIIKSGIPAKMMDGMKSEDSEMEDESEDKEENNEDNSAEKEEYMAELEGKSIEDLKKMIVDMKCEQKEMM
jgi:hypothetical protein